MAESCGCRADDDLYFLSFPFIFFNTAIQGDLLLTRPLAPHYCLFVIKAEILFTSIAPDRSLRLIGNLGLYRPFFRLE